MSRAKTVTHTFRLDSGIINTLIDEANSERVSLNVLVSHILEDYTNYGRFAKRIGVIRMGPPIVKTILAEIPEPVIEKIAAKLGSTHPTEMLTSLGLPHTQDALLRLVEELLPRHASWYQLPRVVKERGWTIHLRHGVSKEWSLFLSGYMAALFESLNFRVVERISTDYSATVRLEQPREIS